MRGSGRTTTSRWAEAAWQGIFHSISAFNNAGFALASDSLISYGQDPLILGPIALAIVLGGLGFLVVVELFRRSTGCSRAAAPPVRSPDDPRRGARPRPRAVPAFALPDG